MLEGRHYQNAYVTRNIDKAVARVTARADARSVVKIAPMLPDDDLPRFHHSCARVPDWEDFRRRVDEQPYPVVIEGTGNDLKFRFLDTRDLLGHYHEYTWMSDTAWQRIGGQ